MQIHSRLAAGQQANEAASGRGRNHPGKESGCYGLPKVACDFILPPQLHMCLGQEDDAGLRKVLRDNPEDNGPLRDAINAAILRKPKGHDFDYSRQNIKGEMKRHMSHTGG